MDATRASNRRYLFLAAAMALVTGVVAGTQAPPKDHWTTACLHKPLREHEENRQRILGEIVRLEAEMAVLDARVEQALEEVEQAQIKADCAASLHCHPHLIRDPIRH